jgi:FixJ family two-component response regulator
MEHSEKTAAEIVCLVDDDPGVLKSISRLLSSDGFSVRSFDKPKSFLAHALAHPVPLVILDIWMEEMNGVQVQAEVAAISPGTRVIIITGRDDAKIRETVLQAGAIAVFTKPFDDIPFLAAVHGGLAELQRE